MKSKIYRLELNGKRTSGASGDRYYSGSALYGTDLSARVAKRKAKEAFVCVEELHDLFDFDVEATGVTLCCSKTRPRHRQSYRFELQGRYVCSALVYGRPEGESAVHLRAGFSDLIVDLIGSGKPHYMWLEVDA